MAFEKNKVKYYDEKCKLYRLLWENNSIIKNI